MKKILLLLSILISIKSLSQANLDWVRKYSTANMDTVQEVTDMVINDSGDVFVTGVSLGITSIYDIVTIKYDANGNQKWLQRYDFRNGFERPSAIHIDSLSNIYICGMVGPNTDTMLVLKYNSYGVLLWDRFYGAGVNNNASDITVDDSGYVYVTGTSSNTIITTIKYDKNGNEKWKVLETAYSAPYDKSFITLDANRNVYVASRVAGPFSTKTIKYNNSGVKQWEQTYIGGASYGSRPKDLKVDKVGNIYVLVQDELCGFVMLKYANAGGTYWISCYDENLTHNWAINQSKAMAIDNLGNACATGGHNPSMNGEVCSTLKFNTSGGLMWYKTYPDSNNNYGNNLAYDIAMDKNGFIYITGQSGIAIGANSIVSIKYDPNGNQVWKAIYTGGTMGIKIAVNKNGDVYCFGQEFLSGDRNYVILKYSQTLAGINEINNHATQIKIYPNPVSNTLQIEGEQKELENSEIEIINCLGQTVIILLYKNEIDVSHLANGFYTLKISNPKQQFYSKFVKD